MNWEKNPPFEIGNDAILMSQFNVFCESHLAGINLKPKLSKQRILETFSAWKEDLNRSKNGNFRNEDILPDHIKSAAVLTYWLRRNAPIVSIDTISNQTLRGMYSEDTTLEIELNCDINNFDANQSGFSKLSPDEQQNITLLNGMTLADFKANRDRAFAYGNELLAFLFGFGLAVKYEEQKQLEQGRTVKIKWPDGIYIEDLCYYFKFKSVSPHSIDLIFRALLKNYEI
ncbi:MAG TPA: hypothetical protein VIO39_07170 [Methylotenera sp.]